MRLGFQQGNPDLLADDDMIVISMWAFDIVEHDNVIAQFREQACVILFGVRASIDVADHFSFYLDITLTKEYASWTCSRSDLSIWDLHLLAF